MNKVKLNPKLNSIDGYKKLTNECITKKNNNIVKKDQEHTFDKFLYDWELNTPKDIRKGALRDIKKAFTTAWVNLKNGNINKFGLSFRKRKKYNQQSMEIPNDAIKIIKKKNKVIGFSIYSTYFGDNPIIKIKDKINIDKIEYYARLKQENNIWYLCIPNKVENKEIVDKQKTCAIDPGVRKFATIYSEEEVISIMPDKKIIKKYYRILDKFKQLRAKKKIKQKTYDKKRSRIQNKIKSQIDEMQYKAILYLTSNYNTILLPSFESQEMVKSKKLNRKVKRDMNTYSFYKFKQRLEHKCKLTKNSNVKIVNEAYT